MLSSKEEFDAWQEQHMKYLNQSDRIFTRIRRKQYSIAKGSLCGWNRYFFDEYGTYKEIIIPQEFLYDEEALEKYIEGLETTEKYA